MCAEKICQDVTSSRANGYIINLNNQHEKKFNFVLADDKISYKNLPKNAKSKIDLDDFDNKAKVVIRKLREFGFDDDEILLILNDKASFKKVAKLISSFGMFNLTSRSDEKTKNKTRCQVIDNIRKLLEYLQRDIVEEEKKETHRKNETLNKLKVLTALYGVDEFIELSDVMARCGISEKHTRRILNEMIDAGHVILMKVGTKHFYRLSHYGTVYLAQRCGTLWQYSLPGLERTSGKDDRQNDRAAQSRIFYVLEMAKFITKKLLSFGWYHRNIQKLFRKFSLQEILFYLRKVEKMKIVGKKNNGKYLWVMLMKDKQYQLEALARRTLSELREEADGALVKAFIEESLSMPPEIFLHFMNCIRKCYRNGLRIREQRAREGNTEYWTFTVGDISGMAGYVWKRAAGVTIR